MSALGRLSWLAVAVTTSALIAILAFFYAKTRDYDESGYAEDVTLLRQVKQVDAQWELNVLKSKGGTNKNYDALTDSWTELSALLEQFEARIQGQAHIDAEGLLRAASVVHEVIQDKASLIEQFKSNNSLLRNSTDFLPTAAREADEAIGRSDGDMRSHEHAARAAANVNSLLVAAILYVQSPTDELRIEIRTGLDRLNVPEPALSSKATELVAIFSAHVGTILREQTVAHELLRAIAANPTSERIDDLNSVLGAERLSAEAQNRHYRGLLLTFSSCIVAMLLFAAARLVRSHAVIRDSRDKLLAYGQGLEMMVADRVAALRESEARMTQLAQFDSLTGLPNRHLFRDRLAHAMASADRTRQAMALMFVDLDEFKQINDSVGHAVGDAVLVAVAQRLRESLREVDTIARLGGDEFTIILEGLSGTEDAIVVAAKIKETMSAPFVVDAREFVVSASVGVAIYPFGSADGDSLFRAADIAMYRAKESGPNAYALFAPEMAVQISERVRMKALLRHALDRDELALHYQPKVELSSGKVTGVEALLRWNSQELGPVSPARFIPLAEEMGLIVPIGAWVLRTACAQGRAWQQRGLPPLTMAVNLSPRQLRDPLLIETIAEALRASQFPAALLELELTEGVIMDDVKGNIETLRAIRDLGASLAVDDFGTGYSSLAYLARLPIQTLKIDRAFVTPMLDDVNATTLVATMITLAHSLDLKVVAEGVETSEQRQRLHRLDCDQIQGYHFSPPVDAAALERLVRRQAWPARAQNARAPDAELIAVGS